MIQIKPCRAVIMVIAACSSVVFAGSTSDPSVLWSDADRIVLQFEISDYVLTPVLIEGVEYFQVEWAGEPVLHVAGAPALPKVARSVVIPDDGVMSARVIASEFVDIPEVMVISSKGSLLRTVNPADVPYTFGDAYLQDAYYPGNVIQIGVPYILRDYRGAVVTVHPFQCNPVTRTLRVFTHLTVEVSRIGDGGANVLVRHRSAQESSVAFSSIYGRHFVNYGSQSAGPGRGTPRYPPASEIGDMVIIAYDEWVGNLEPLAEHKIARGVPTTIVPVSTIPGGNTATAIGDYIQATYDAGSLAFVLLVGDHTQVATPKAWGSAADPTYALVAGTDHYPDVFIGRFSAETASDVDIQVLRTVEYEQMPATQMEWFKKGVGVASNQGPGDDGELDYEHIDVIRGKLLDYGYTWVDQIYDPTATKTMISNALNDGRGILNYCGHGSTTSWGTTGFSNADVNNLVNDNRLPFIFDVACVNGDFDGPTCFAEAWLRAENAGEPTGAIGMYASSINQYWDEPMVAQDESVDLLVGEAYVSLGVLAFCGSCQMMDEFPTTGVEMFDTWHLFGDPSLRVFQSCSDAGTLSLDAPEVACEDSLSITVTDCGLNTSPVELDTVSIVVASTSEPAGESMTLFETGADTAELTGSLMISESDSPGVLKVAPGDTVTAIYMDADDGQGGTNVEVTGSAGVDCASPMISDVEIINVEPFGATVKFVTDEPSMGTIRFGSSCDALTDSITEPIYVMEHSVIFTGLQPRQSYSLAVEAMDEAGNITTNDNGGACFAITTPAASTIMIVDDDDNVPNVSAYYTDALTQLGWKFDVWDRSSTGAQPDLMALEPYQFVLWFTGGKSDGSCGPDADGETALIAFLDGGGRMFMSSQGYFDDRDLTPLMSDYLGVKRAGEDALHTEATGQGSVFGDFGTMILSYPFANDSDRLGPDDASESAFIGQKSIAAVDKDGGAYRTTYWAFPFEAIPEAADREALMARIIDWFGVTQPFCEGDANDDGVVDPLDSGYVQARMSCAVGTGDAECDAADVNSDLVVDPLDVGYVLARFGGCP